MTLSFTLPRRLLSAFGIALICAVPTAYAAELEGTIVPLNAPEPISTLTESAPNESAPAADAAAEPDHPVASEAEQAPPPPAAQHWQNHNNWERDWEKNLSNAFGGDHEDSGGFHPALLIPLFAIVFIFGGPIVLLILILVFFFGAKRRRQQDINMNIDKLLAAGRDIPVELLRGDEPKSDEPVGSRDKGIRNIFLGTGWLVFLTVMVGFDIGSAGFIWIALGASQVLIWYLNRPNGIQQAGQQD